MVDLVNEADSAVIQLLLNIKKLQTNGNIDLPVSFTTGGIGYGLTLMNI